VKISLQMLIGVGIVLLVILEMLRLLAALGISMPLTILVSFLSLACESLYQVTPMTCSPASWTSLLDGSILKTVGQALSYAAAIELAYMLFTPEPDEAVQPLILGLASAALILASDTPQDQNTLRFAGAVGVYSVAIALLFYIREKYVNHSPLSKLDSKNEAQPPGEPQRIEVNATIQSRHTMSFSDLFGFRRREK
jgi:hypothetical protein